MSEQEQGAVDGAVTVEGPRDKIHCLTIIGQIEGHVVLPSQTKTTQYEHVMPQLAAIEESPEIDGLLLLLNTVGGDVEAGLALSELICGMKKPTVSLVLGGGHSIGVPLAVSAKRSFIVPTATMTLHPVRFNGMVMGMPQTMSYFQRIEERIVSFIARNSRIDPDTLRELMHCTGELLNDVGSVVTGEEAVALGICDKVGGLSDALSCLHSMIEEGSHHGTHEPVSR